MLLAADWSNKPSSSTGRDLLFSTKMRFEPEPFGSTHRINFKRIPESTLIAFSVKLAVMTPTNRNRKLVAYLASECLWLTESKMMGI